MDRLTTMCCSPTPIRLSGIQSSFQEGFAPKYLIRTNMVTAEAYPTPAAIQKSLRQGHIAIVAS